jgi:hypothetical protein
MEIPTEGGEVTITDIDFARELAARQLEIPGMDGYVAERLQVNLSGGVEFTDVTQADDVAFVKSLHLGQEVTLTVTATVTKAGYTLTPGRDDLTDDKLAYGVGLKVHSLEVA